MKKNKRSMKNQIELLVQEANINMTEIEKNKVSKAIHMSAAAAAGVGAGLAQIPGSDAPVIVTVQIAMIQKLGNIFGLKISETSAETLIGTSLATFLGRGISQWAVGWIPIAGNIINASTAALITELLGWIVANQFSKEGVDV